MNDFKFGRNGKQYEVRNLKDYYTVVSESNVYLMKLVAYNDRKIMLIGEETLKKTFGIDDSANNNII